MDNGRIFREKSLERLSTPEDLSDYLRVTDPGIWMVLASVMAFLIGVVAWGCLAHLETTLPVRVEVVNNEATTVVTGEDVGKIGEGMTIRAADSEGRIDRIETDEYGRKVVGASLFAEDGIYDGDIVTERVRPISFLFR